jgi:hypothetical protein
MTSAGGASFDSDTLGLLREVLDDAWRSLSPKQLACTLKSDIAL